MNTLQQWEDRLSPFFKSGLRIIGEIPLSYADIEEIGSLIKKYVDQHGYFQATQNIQHLYPLSFVTLLSIFSAYNTQQNFWQAFADFVHLDKGNIFNYKWHHVFVEIVEERGFKFFDAKKARTHYVMTIRFHGGIPIYSLPDYFERIVIPTVQRPGISELPSTNALKFMLDHAYFVDSPVINFLENSEELGLHFFDESRKLARHAESHYGEILGADQIDLPLYVINAFEAFLEKSEDERQHWRKPELLAAPYSEESAVNLLLPEQEIRLDRASQKMLWLIEWDGQASPIEVPCQVFRQRQNLTTKKEYRIIEEAPQSIRVSILAQDPETGTRSELRRWNLALVPPEGQAPLIVFNSDFRKVSAGLALPAEPLYLAYPLDTELDFVGEARVFEHCSPLIGAWKDWQIVGWDLTNAWSVQVLREGSPLGKVLPIQGSITRPELSGGHPFQFQDESDLPVYTSELPEIRIPVSNKQDLHSWETRIRSVLDASPIVDVSFKWSKYLTKVRLENDWAFLPLKEILGEKPTGTYQVEVRGPRENRSEFNFRFWPKLLIQGHSLQLTRPKPKPAPTTFSIRLPEKAHCAAQPGPQHVQVEQRDGQWHITVPPGTPRVDLDLSIENDHGYPVRVPIMIPMPVLQWAVATEHTPGSLNFTQTIVQKSLDALLQTGNASLHLTMYGLGSMIKKLKVRLVDLGESETVLHEADLKPTDLSRDWLRVSLAQFSDSLKNVNAIANVELAYFAEKEEVDAVRIPLIEVSRNLEIREVTFHPLSDTSWKVTWKEEHPLKNRRMMIRSAWKPWEKPMELKIPDKAKGEYIIDDIGLPPALYQVYFYIRPTWASALKEPPENVEAIEITLCTPQERLSMIPENGSSPDDKYKIFLEQAAIHDYMGDQLACGTILSKCTILLKDLTNLDLLLSSLKWIEGRQIDPPNVKSFFFTKMFFRDIVLHILDRYDETDPAFVEYLQYSQKTKITLSADSAKLILQRVNEPVAVFTCLNTLLNKKDPELLLIILNMLEASRLSIRDAIEMLSTSPQWSIGKICERPAGIFTDTILAGLLPKISDQMKDLSEEQVCIWITRSIPYENDAVIIQSYLDFLFKESCPHPYNLLITLLINNKIFSTDALNYMSKEPEKAIAAIDSSEYSDDLKDLREQLTARFPHLSGDINAGTKLRTPIGEGVIVKIEKNDLLVEKANITDRTVVITVKTGEGKSSFIVRLDIPQMEYTIKDTDKVWKCGQCDFYHPDQNSVVHHAGQVHGHASLYPLQLPCPFNPDTITIVD